MTEKQILSRILENDPAAIMDFFFVRCRDIFNKPVGRDRFEDIVDRYGLKVLAKVRKPKTTVNDSGLTSVGLS